MENEFNSDDTEPFPFDGQPLITTPSPPATSKEEDELQSAKEELSKFSRRSSPALFEFSDDESQPLVQVDDLIKLSEQTSRFEEVSRILTKAMTKNTACMNRLLDREEASTSREINNGKAEQKRSTAERCADCGKIKRRDPQQTSSVKIGQIKVKISFEIENCEGRREPAANDRFRPTIDAWLKRWKNDDEENQWIFTSAMMNSQMKYDEPPPQRRKRSSPRRRSEAPTKSQTPRSQVSLALKRHWCPLPKNTIKCVIQRRRKVKVRCKNINCR